MFVQSLRTLFPQFAEQDRNGFMQQDAEECCEFFISNILFFIGGQVIQALGEKVFGLSADGQLNRAIKFVDQFMSAEFLVE
jgi:hypothetical protein